VSAFVANATEGCNAVLRSFALAPDDEILVLDHGYGAVRNTVRHVAASAGARVIEAALPFPRPDPAALVAAVTAALRPRTKLAVLDHITSPSAIVLPLAEIIAACRVAGVAVLVDGAHAPGHVALDLAALGADWYVGNCHKWLCGPEGSGFLWAAPARQAGLHPAVISHGYGHGFVAEFGWTGTRDPSAFLAVPAALEFCTRLGGPALVARNRVLAAAAGAWLAERLGTEVGTAGAAAGCMASVRLPLVGPLTQARVGALAGALLVAGTDAPAHRIGNAAWLRVSAHAYNTMEDYARLADTLARVLPAA
jgi:isopenicillin-N epimerase